MENPVKDRMGDPPQEILPPRRITRAADGRQKPDAPLKEREALLRKG
jgi:hypothetical protein